MMHTSRRQFLTATAASAATTAASSFSVSAADPTTPPRRPLMKLSLAAYSFHRLLPRRGTPEQIASAQMKLEDFIDFAADQGLGAAELTSYYFPKYITHDYLMTLKAKTHRLGLSISGTAIANNFCVPDGPEHNRQLEKCRRWIDYAAAMGAPVIRIFAGRVPKGDTEATAVARCVAGINTSLKYAATRGVLLALENHGGITATVDQMLNIINQVDDSPWFGVNFDSGNFHTDDPYRDLERIAHLTVNAQIKVMMSEAGEEKPADLPRIIDILKKVGYRGYVSLEYEEKEDPFVAIPRYLRQLQKIIETGSGS